MDGEKELIILLNQGNHQAFSELYTSYKYRVCKFIYAMLHSYEETEEVFQSVFEKIWENRTLIKHEKSLSAYIYKIARNQVYDMLRKRTYRHLFERYITLAESNEMEDSVEHIFEDNDLKNQMNQLIKTMPERRREIFLLRYQHKHSYREIASKLNITENTVDSQIRNALNFLRAHITKEMLVLAIVAKIAACFFEF